MRTKLKMIFAFILLAGISACSSDDNSTNSDDYDNYDNPNNAKREKVKVEIRYSGDNDRYGPFILIHSWITNSEGQYIIPLHDEDDYIFYEFHPDDFLNRDVYNLHTKIGVEGVTVMASFFPDDDIGKEYYIKIFTDSKVLDERTVKYVNSTKVNYTVLVE